MVLRRSMSIAAVVVAFATTLCCDEIAGVSLRAPVSDVVKVGDLAPVKLRPRSPRTGSNTSKTKRLRRIASGSGSHIYYI